METQPSSSSFTNKLRSLWGRIKKSSHTSKRLIQAGGHYPNYAARRKFTPSDAVFLLIDAQEKLVPLIAENRRLVWNVKRLLLGMRVLNVPIRATEQYPTGLGGTLAELVEQLPAEALPIPAKLAFSAYHEPQCCDQIDSLHRTLVIVVGIEAHVCVLQTALDLLRKQYAVWVVVDAVDARHELDRETAFQRLREAGAQLVTTEMVLFELCQVAGTPQFKELSRLVRQSPPTD